MKTTKDLSFRFAYAFVVRQMKTIYINKLKDLEVGNIIPLQGLLNSFNIRLHAVVHAFHIMNFRH